MRHPRGTRRVGVRGRRHLLHALRRGGTQGLAGRPGHEQGLDPLAEEGPGAWNWARPGENDSASASYGTTFYDGRTWHMFYLGTPHTSPAPDLVPAFPYLTMKARSDVAGRSVDEADGSHPLPSQAGHVLLGHGQPRPDRQAGRRVPHVLQRRGRSSDPPYPEHRPHEEPGRSLDPRSPADPARAAEQVENSSLYFEPANRTWFLFTNHVGLDSFEYTDAVWVYWSKDLDRWDPAHKAVVLDRSNCSWSKHIIGLPSVVRVGDRLALFYDGNARGQDARGRQEPHEP